MDLNISTKDYMGKWENGVVALLSIKKDNIISEAVYWYDSQGNAVITIDEDILQSIGNVTIETWEHYDEMMNHISKNVVVPYIDIYNKIDDIDMSQYFDRQE
jgi:hypothetical protein